jgi:hypothetical protein
MFSGTWVYLLHENITHHKIRNHLQVKLTCCYCINELPDEQEWISLGLLSTRHRSFFETFYSSSCPLLWKLNVHHCHKHNSLCYDRRMMHDYPSQGTVFTLRSGFEPAARWLPVQPMWDLWRTKWNWNRFFYEFFRFSCQYHSIVFLHTHISSRRWTICPLVEAVQRRRL